MAKPPSTTNNSEKTKPKTNPNSNKWKEKWVTAIKVKLTSKNKRR
jgi:hypothetical protein